MRDIKLVCVCEQSVRSVATVWIGTESFVYVSICNLAVLFIYIFLELENTAAVMELEME